MIDEIRVTTIAEPYFPLGLPIDATVATVPCCLNYLFVRIRIMVINKVY